MKRSKPLAGAASKRQCYGSADIRQYLRGSRYVTQLRPCMQLQVCRSITGIACISCFTEVVEEGLDVESDLGSVKSDSTRLHYESHSDPETEFVSNGEPSQLDESLNELPGHRKPSQIDDLLSSLGETPQLSELQHSVSELPAHSAELHPAVTSGDFGKVIQLKALRKLTDNEKLVLLKQHFVPSHNYMQVSFSFVPWPLSALSTEVAGAVQWVSLLGVRRWGIL